MLHHQKPANPRHCWADGIFFEADYHPKGAGLVPKRGAPIRGRAKGEIPNPLGIAEVAGISDVPLGCGWKLIVTQNDD